jgi:predicted ATPase
VTVLMSAQLPDPAPEGYASLLGRSEELALVARFVDRVRAASDALLITGEAGVGKTALLDAARMASAAGFRILRASGTVFEAELSYAALNQVLLSLRGEFGRVSPACRDVLEVALGFGAGQVPDRLAVCNAILELLDRAAITHPILLVVDDLPWLDRASAAVLGSVARRLSGGIFPKLGITSRAALRDALTALPARANSD